MTLGVAADVTDPAAVERAVAQGVAAFGEVGVLVNNAACTWAASTGPRRCRCPSGAGSSRSNLLDTQLIKRFAVPDDVAGVVLFLCSPEAGFLTGQTVLVDGGFFPRA